MKIKVLNSNVEFLSNPNKTIVFTEQNCRAGYAYQIADGTVVDVAGNERITNIFPYNGGDIVLNHSEYQWYGKCMLNFFTDSAGTNCLGTIGTSTSTTNGLAAYITSEVSDTDVNYNIPESVILETFPTAKYVRFGFGASNIGIANAVLQR